MPETKQDEAMLRVLEAMLHADQLITARAVANKHPDFDYASSITRNPGRSELLARYQARQAEYRSWRIRTQKGSREKLASELAERDQKIKKLEGQVAALQMAVLAMIKAVGELGGFSRFLKFFDGYRQVSRELIELGVIPETHVENREGESL